MILIDTSTLIDSLKGNANNSTKALEKIIEKEMPFCISILTYQEILQGAKSDTEFEKLKSYFSTLNILYLPHDIDFYNFASDMRVKLKQKGITINSSIDFLIAMTAISNGYTLLHNDKDYECISNEFPELVICYDV